MQFPRRALLPTKNEQLQIAHSKYSYINRTETTIFKHSLILIDNLRKELNNARWNGLWTVNPASASYGFFLHAMTLGFLVTRDIYDVFEQYVHGELRGEIDVQDT